MKTKTIILISLLLFLFCSSAAAQAPGKIFRKGNQLIYTIKPGDTFYKLSKHFNVPVTNIQSLNPDYDPRNLQVGDEIKIRVNPDLKLHNVEPGETIWEISQQYSIPLLGLIENNLLPNPDLIIPGEVILIPKKIETKLYFLKFTQQDAFIVPEKREVAFTSNRYVSTLEELISGPTQTENTHMPIPENTEVLGVEIKNGIAYANFSQEIYRSNVGSASEFLLLTAITNTLTEFEKIKGVRILVEGKSVETIGGHIVLDKILRRSMNVVK